MGIGRFRGDAHLGTWLRGIAQHVILEAARTAILRQRFQDGHDGIERLRENLHARAMPDPEASAVRKSVLRKVFQELQSVLGSYNTLFIKRHLEEFSEDELAEAEGMRRGTVSCYLSRARNRLRQQHTRFMVLK